MFDYHRVFEEFVYNKIPKLQAGGYSVSVVEDILAEVFEPDDFTHAMQRMEE